MVMVERHLIINRHLVEIDLVHANSTVFAPRYKWIVYETSHGGDVLYVGQGIKTEKEAIRRAVAWLNHAHAAVSAGAVRWAELKERQMNGAQLMELSVRESEVSTSAIWSTW
jgi:hypothetical protein